MEVISIVRSSVFTFISGAVRNLAVVALTWLVSRKVIDADTGSQLLALAPTVIAAVLWSLIEKYIFAKRNLGKVQTALGLPAGSSMADLKAELKTQKAQQ